MDCPMEASEGLVAAMFCHCPPAFLRCVPTWDPPCRQVIGFAFLPVRDITGAGALAARGVMHNGDSPEGKLSRLM
jgi:hypothetical protein